MDPIHDTRRRFDVRFHLVAVTFLVFDVELLFLYPWAVASRSPAGIDAAVAEGMLSVEVLLSLAVLSLFFSLLWALLTTGERGSFDGGSTVGIK